MADGLHKLTLHPHPEQSEWVMACLVSGKSYSQVIEETVAEYLTQKAQPDETVRHRQLKRNPFTDGIQNALFTFITGECPRLPLVKA